VLVRVLSAELVVLLLLALLQWRYAR